MEKTIKIALAILMLLCLLNMPYGYYMFVRLVALVGFGILAFQAYGEKKENVMLVYIALAILFQPIIKIPLGRMLWNIVDVIVAVGLIISVVSARKIDKNKE